MSHGKALAYNAPEKISNQSTYTRRDIDNWVDEYPRGPLFHQQRHRAVDFTIPSLPMLT